MAELCDALMFFLNDRDAFAFFGPGGMSHAAWVKVFTVNTGRVCSSMPGRKYVDTRVSGVAFHAF